MFEIPKIFEEIKMADYAPEFGELKLKVWVNPPRILLNEMNEISQNFTIESVKKAAGLIGKIWDESADKVEELVEKASETDPQLFQWMMLRTFRAIQEHRSQVKKNWKQEFLS